MDYCDIEWFALETNRDHSVFFEIASKYCILDSFVDIPSEGFLRAVVDIRVTCLGRGAAPLGCACVLSQLLALVRPFQGYIQLIITD